MPYVYSDPSRESETYSLPNVEIFEIVEGDESELEAGWYYAFGFPGCLWDGEPDGPYASEAEAVEAAREE